MQLQQVHAVTFACPRLKWWTLKMRSQLYSRQWWVSLDMARRRWDCEDGLVCSERVHRCIDYTCSPSFIVNFALITHLGSRIHQGKLSNWVFWSSTRNWSKKRLSIGGLESMSSSGMACWAPTSWHESGQRSKPDWAHGLQWFLHHWKWLCLHQWTTSHSSAWSKEESSPYEG